MSQDGDERVEEEEMVEVKAEIPEVPEVPEEEGAKRKREEDSDDDFAVVKKKKGKKDKKKKKKEEEEEEQEVKEEVKEEVADDEVRTEAVTNEQDPEVAKEVEDQMKNVFDDGQEEEAWRRVLDALGSGEDADELTAELRKEATGDAATEEKKPANKQFIDSITLTRTQDIAPHCQLFFFRKLVSGAFVRAVVENTKATHPTYALFEVQTAIPSGTDPITGAAKTYKVNDTLTDWLLVCRSGKHERKIKLSSVSNDKCTEEEYLSYMKRMERHGIPVITRKRAAEKRSQIWKLYSDYYKKPLTESQVEEIVETRKRLRGKASVNLVRNKLILQKELEELALRRMYDDAEDNAEMPEEYKEVEAEHDADFAWKKYYEDMEMKKRRLEIELEETEKKLQSVLYGQNSSFETLAMLTHRNAAANKGRVEATDPIDTIVFGRKEGRSGKSYWSVSEGGFAEKKKEIDQFWVEKQEKEATETQATRDNRKEELKIGTCPIKDLDKFTQEVGKEDLTQLQRELSSQASQPSQSQRPATQGKKSKKGKKDVEVAPPEPTRKLSVADFLARKKV
eukprot:TRINITY_DN22517_c0_g1_i1.p2 TRINITY_DN22517_c0_g1~~TRINITY_DN22517_c0_g1_i1.p2  ORF type:complete len:566 (+),score=172.77 TRINITY_DN22517_c0_g1_i1:2159-3856(+)